MAYMFGKQLERSFYAGSAQDSTATPGKQTLTQQQQPADDGGLALVIDAVQQMAGQTLGDGGGYQYVIQPTGAFLITAAPPERPQALGVSIRISDAAWLILANIALNSGQCRVDDSQMSIGQPEAPAPAPDQSIGQPAPAPSSKGKVAVPSGVDSMPADKGDTKYLLHAIPLAVGDVARVEFDCAIVTPKNPYAQPTSPRIPLQTYVQILELGGEIVRVEQGWVRANKLKRLNRPPKTDTPDKQMAALVSVARNANTTQHARCYRFVKNYIVLAGGYGDIADINTDPRFDGFQDKALDFVAAVTDPAAFGLEKISSLSIATQSPGTLLVTKGNGKTGISTTDGDIAVIDAIEGSQVRCYNDGVIHFPVDPAEWGPGKLYSDTFVAMYRPIARK